jgi:hypothetical protein
MRLLAAFLACLISTAALADSINVGPTAVGTAAAGQVPGTATNDSAAAGKVGEWITNSVAAGSEVALTTSTQTNISSGVTLTAGDWNCYGSIYYKASGDGNDQHHAAGDISFDRDGHISDRPGSVCRLEPACLCAPGKHD